MSPEARALGVDPSSIIHGPMTVSTQKTKAKSMQHNPRPPICIHLLFSSSSTANVCERFVCLRIALASKKAGLKMQLVTGTLTKAVSFEIDTEEN